MNKLSTHYDTLKVTRDAPVEVIRAAYRTLAQKHHPDTNPNSSEMRELNAAFEVLNDAQKRARYDQQMEASAEFLRNSTPSKDTSRPGTKPVARQTTATHKRAQMSDDSGGGDAYIAFAFVLAIALGVLLLALWSSNSRETPSPSKRTLANLRADRPVDLERIIALTRPPYSRPATAPNGAPWPRVAAEITGYPPLDDDGHSTVTIDNRRNDSDVFLKLVSRSGGIDVPVRHIFIPAGGEYTCTDVRAGAYDVRYRDLDTGALLRSERFQLEEERTFDGIRYSTIEITLYKVANGNMETYPISEAEF